MRRSPVHNHGQTGAVRPHIKKMLSLVSLNILGLSESEIPANFYQIEAICTMQFFVCEAGSMKEVCITHFCVINNMSCIAHSN